MAARVEIGMTSCDDFAVFQVRTARVRDFRSQRSRYRNFVLGLGTKIMALVVWPCLPSRITHAVQTQPNRELRTQVSDTSKSAS